MRANPGGSGADVIKVENPASGDDTRRWGPPFLKDESGAEADAAYYLCANRNKRSIAVNITDPDGQAILKRLAAESDVVIENYKTGGLRKYGLDYDSLSAINPDLVYCSVTGFGQTGPWSNQPGYDFLIQAMGGLMSVTGEDAPMKVGVPAVDLFTGVYAAGAVMAALIARSTGRGGQHIDMALFDVQAAMLANQAANYLFPASRQGAPETRIPISFRIRTSQRRTGDWRWLWAMMASSRRLHRLWGDRNGGRTRVSGEIRIASPTGKSSSLRSPWSWRHGARITG